MARRDREADKLRRRWCRVVGHRRWFVNDPAWPDDLTFGCRRCKDPSTFSTFVYVDSDLSSVVLDHAQMTVFLEGNHGAS